MGSIFDAKHGVVAFEMQLAFWFVVAFGSMQGSSRYEYWIDPFWVVLDMLVPSSVRNRPPNRMKFLVSWIDV